MKRSQLIKYLRMHGCSLAREGANHTIFENKNNATSAAIPRHNEIGDILAKEICKELGIPKIK
jgi:mRNA interferase HicA